MQQRLARVERALLSSLDAPGLPLPEVLATFEAELSALRGQSAALLAAEAEAQRRLAGLERQRASVAARARELDGLAELWKRGERAALREVLALAVEQLDLRVRGESALTLRSGFTNSSITSPKTGVCKPAWLGVTLPPRLVRAA